MGKQPEEPGTALARLDEYARRPDAMAIYPNARLTERVSSPFLVVDVLPVRFDPDPKGADVYVAWWNSRELALRAQGLSRLGMAAGIKWARTEFEREPTEPGHRAIVATAMGGILLPNGETYWIPRSKGIDTAIQEEKWLAEELKKGTSRAQAEVSVRNRILALKEHYREFAETKAMSRVLRVLLNVRQSYTPDVYRKTWWIPTLSARPDLNDPRQLAAAIVEGRSAVAALYGSRESSPVDQPPTDTGEAAPGATATQQAPTPASGVPEREASGAAAPKGSGGEAQSAATGSGAEPTPPEHDTPPEMHISELLQGRASPWGDLMLSELAQDHPEFLQGLAKEGRNKTIRETAAAWLHYYQPGLLGG